MIILITAPDDKDYQQPRVQRLNLGSSLRHDALSSLISIVPKNLTCKLDSRVRIDHNHFISTLVLSNPLLFPFLSSCFNRTKITCTGTDGLTGRSSHSKESFGLCLGCRVSHWFKVGGPQSGCSKPTGECNEQSKLVCKNLIAAIHV